MLKHNYEIRERRGKKRRKPQISPIIFFVNICAICEICGYSPLDNVVH